LGKLGTSDSRNLLTEAHLTLRTAGVQLTLWTSFLPMAPPVKPIRNRRSSPDHNSASSLPIILILALLGRFRRPAVANPPAAAAAIREVDKSVEVD